MIYRASTLAQDLKYVITVHDDGEPSYAELADAVPQDKSVTDEEIGG